MVDRCIKFHCENTQIKFPVDALRNYRSVQQDLDELGIATAAYLCGEHGHYLQIDAHYQSRDTGQPADLYYNSIAGILYDCRDCGSTFALSIHDSKKNTDYECFHFVQKTYRLHYLWIGKSGRVKAVEHVESFVRKSELPKEGPTN